MALPPRTLVGETLGRQGIQNGPISKILQLSCSSSDSDSSSVSLSEPDPLKCQFPLSRVSRPCREYCRRTMSQEAIQCQNNCRKYMLMTDTQTGDTYRGFTTLIRYLLDPSGDMARITLFVPLLSRMAEQFGGWTFIGRDPPGAIHDYFRTFSCPNALDCAIEDITFSPIDLPRYDSVPGYRCDAFWTLWEPAGKHLNEYGELNLILHLASPVSMRVGIPRALSVQRPTTRIQREFALAGDSTQASQHPLVPRNFVWPVANAMPRLARPARRMIRTPTLNSIRTRSGEEYEGIGPATRRRRTEG